MTTFVKVILQGWNHGIGVCLRPRASLVCGQDSLQQGESPAQPWVKIKASPIFSRLFLRTFLHLVVKSVFLWKSFNCIVLKYMAVNFYFLCHLIDFPRFPPRNSVALLITVNFL